MMTTMKARVYIETSVVSYLQSRLSTDMIVAAHQELCTPEELMED